MTTYEEWRVTGRCRHMLTANSYSFTSEDAALKWLAEWTCGWVDGPDLRLARREPRFWGEHPAHPTCIDVTAIDQPPGSEWACGPECPKEA